MKEEKTVEGKGGTVVVVGLSNQVSKSGLATRAINRKGSVRFISEKRNRQNDQTFKFEER